MAISAIETSYKGYRFRSRLEARWALFFDLMHRPWEYEPQGYDVGGETYLPDFYLPRVPNEWTDHCQFDGIFLEVKPRSAASLRIAVPHYPEVSEEDWRANRLRVPREQRLVWDLAVQTGNLGCVVYGDPYEVFEEVYDVESRELDGPGLLFETTFESIDFMNDYLLGEWDWDDLNSAVLKARQARFEHGEKPR